MTYVAKITGDKSVNEFLDNLPKNFERQAEASKAELKYRKAQLVVYFLLAVAVVAPLVWISHMNLNDPHPPTINYMP